MLGKSADDCLDELELSTPKLVPIEKANEAKVDIAWADGVHRMIPIT